MRMQCSNMYSPMLTVHCTTAECSPAGEGALFVYDLWHSIQEVETYCINRGHTHVLLVDTYIQDVPMANVVQPISWLQPTTNALDSSGQMPYNSRMLWWICEYVPVCLSTFSRVILVAAWLSSSYTIKNALYYACDSVAHLRHRIVNMKSIIASIFTVHSMLP